MKSKISYLWLITVLIIVTVLITQIIILIRGANFYENQQGIDLSLFKWIQSLLYSPKLIGLILLLFATIGLFIFNIAGWIAMCSLFYFYSVEYLFFTRAAYADNDNWPGYIFFVIPLLVVGFINLKNLRARYRIDSNMIILSNLISLSIAMSLTLLKRHIFFNNIPSVSEMIEKVI